MIKPKRLKKGDKIAIVSLSWGGLGDANLIHKYDIAKERLERDFGKPQDERFYEEYKEVYRAVLKEFDRETLPVIYNVNIGHATPTGILPVAGSNKMAASLDII